MDEILRFGEWWWGREGVESVVGCSADAVEGFVWGVGQSNAEVGGMAG